MTNFVTMKNITISMDEDTGQWISALAARQGTSVSRLVAQILRERREQDGVYVEAMERFLARPALPLENVKGRYPCRDALYDRSVRRGGMR